MPDESWQATRGTRIFVWVFLGVAIIGVPLLAFAVWRTGEATWLAIVLLGVAVLLAGYAWRFGLWPRISATTDQLVVRNPLRTRQIPWNQIRGITAGHNGIEIESDDQTFIEAWCVQKSKRAIRLDLPTRADYVVASLKLRLRQANPVVADSPPTARLRFDEPDVQPTAPPPPAPAPSERDQDRTLARSAIDSFAALRPTDGARPVALPRAGVQPDPNPEPDDDNLIIRRASAADLNLLAELEREAYRIGSPDNTRENGHDETSAFPLEQVRERWGQRLADRNVWVRVAETDEQMIGYLAYNRTEILRLGVAQTHRQLGFEAQLLEYAENQMQSWAKPNVTTVITAWVPAEDAAARHIFSARDFVETGAAERSRLAPHPIHLQLRKTLPAK